MLTTALQPLKGRGTKSEIMHAIGVGRARNREAIIRGYRDRYGLVATPEEALQIHIEGSCGECVAGKVIDLPWHASVNTFNSEPDIGLRTEVRTVPHERTKSGRWKRLLIRPEDLKNHPDSYYVLAVGHRPDYMIVGWIKCSDAQREDWKQTYGDRPPAYFVPDEALCKDLMLLRQLDGCEAGYTEPR